MRGYSKDIRNLKKTGSVNLPIYMWEFLDKQAVTKKIGLNQCLRDILDREIAIVTKTTKTKKVIR